MHQTRAIQIRFFAIFAVLLPAVLLNAEPAEKFQKEIRPILESHCYECHGPEKQKADLNLAVYSEFEQVAGAPEIWQLVLERVQAFEMPPKGKAELNFGKHQKLMEWLRALRRPESTDCDQLASDRNTSFYRGYVMSRRLNRDEYNNTIRDLFGVDLHVQDLLPADGGGGEGFDTTGSALFVSSIHIEKYLAAAERIVQTIVCDPPGAVSPELANARKQLLIATPSPCLPAREAARMILESFARRAFRRPVTPEEVGRLLALFDRGGQRGEPFLPSLRLAIKGVLLSPNFLFLVEPEPEVGGVQRLGSGPLASRLSYFLWSSMPDAELLALAENGDLFDERVYRCQVSRMLADPKAQALGERFALQWLDLDRLGTDVRPDPHKFPEFDEELCAAMRQEVTAFFNYLIQNDRPLIELIDSRFTFANARLAQLYDLPRMTGSALELVSLRNEARGGVVGMAAVHALSSFPTRTSPVLRGRWILESLLGEKVPPPPPDVPPLAESAVAGGPRTLRQQLEVHRANSECASCHSKMDPLGFGLENFDVLGRWRDQDQGNPIDAQGTLPSGQQFTGPAGLKGVLMARKDDVVKQLVRKMAGFAFGRELNRFDNCTVDRTVKALQANGYRASVLIEQIATSFPFQNRFYPKQN